MTTIKVMHPTKQSKKIIIETLNKDKISLINLIKTICYYLQYDPYRCISTTCFLFGCGKCIGLWGFIRTTIMVRCTALKEKQLYLQGLAKAH